jgi:hypothetical protein
MLLCGCDPLKGAPCPVNTHNLLNSTAKLPRRKFRVATLEESKATWAFVPPVSE